MSDTPTTEETFEEVLAGRAAAEADRDDLAMRLAFANAGFGAISAVVAAYGTTHKSFESIRDVLVAVKPVTKGVWS